MKLSSQDPANTDTLTLSLREVTPGVYRNIESYGQDLSLGETTDPSAHLVFRVINEEVLDFEVTTSESDTVLCAKNVMVDRGEFVAVAGSEEDKWFNIVDAFNQSATAAKTGMTDEYSWTNNGFFIGKIYEEAAYTATDYNYEVSKVDALASGGESGKSCADMLFYAGHGSCGGVIMTFMDPPPPGGIVYGMVSWAPSVLSSHSNFKWVDDVEFCVVSACQTLGTWGEEEGTAKAARGHVNAWINNVFGTGIHALLGTCGEVTAGELDDDSEYFINHLKSGNTVVESWKSACLEWDDSFYGILVREKNLNDYLITPVSAASSGKQLTRDITTTKTTFVYYWYKGKSYVFTPPAKRVHPEERYNKRLKALKRITEFKKQIQVKHFEVKKEKGIPNSVILNTKKNFKNAISKNNKILAWNVLKHKLCTKHERTPERIPEIMERLKKLGTSVPEDYKLSSSGQMMGCMVNNLRGNNPIWGNDWCEGESFTFIREIDNKKIINEKCRIVVKGNALASFGITRHSFKEVGLHNVKQIEFNGEMAKKNDLDLKDLKTELVYVVENNIKVMPLWMVQYKKDVFLFDALKGIPYELK